MKLNSKALPTAALVASALGAWGLTACGGGGSHSAANTSGVVQGSLYEGAKVCVADTSGNATSNCTTSAADGTFTLAGSGPFVADLSGAKEHVVAGDAGTVAPAGLRFHAPEGTTNLSLQSELVWQLIQAGASETDAWTSVGRQFNGLTENQLKGKFSALDSSVQSSLHNSSTDYVKDIAPSTPDLSKIQNVVFIYAENHSFDNLYGSFPGANDIPSTNAPQIDRDGTTLATLPPIWGGLSNGATVDTTGGSTASTITQAQTIGMANKPFQIDTTNFNNTGITVDQTVVTTDMYHRFYNEQMQIGADGKRASTVAWADSGGGVMGYYDGSKMALWQLAKQYTLADNFYQAAFGGSFLNHQYLVCACAPEYPNAATDPATPAIAQIDAGDGKGRTGIQGVALTLNTSNPASAISGKPTFASDQYVTPQVSIDTSTGKATYGSAGTWYGVNTMQPPYQPSSNAPASSDSTFLTADRRKGNTLPAQSKTTIADALDAKSVSWAWYSGAWNVATAASTASGHNLSSATAAGVNFQFHHQPFNYYAKFDPTNSTSAAYRAAHLKDETDLTSAIANGTLPQVAFYKPNGPYNQHPGYASVKEGDDKIANLVNTIMNSSYKDKVLIVITYDEFGGQWDHAKVPKGDWVGPGTRIPALIISPFAKKGFVDHTQYDTASILRFLVKWKQLDAATYLPGLAMRDNALVANGGKAMGDLTSALVTN